MPVPLGQFDSGFCLLRFGGDWNAEPERRAPIRVVVDSDLAAMQVDHLLADRQAQARTTFAAGGLVAQARIFGKGAFHVFFGQAGARIADFQHSRTIHDVGAHEGY